MNDDKYLDEYLKGKLPYSDLYQKASQDDKCPDHLSIQISADAERAGLAPSRDSGLSIRAFPRLRQRSRLWLEAILLITAVIVLIISLYAPSNPPELECPGTTIER